jgi:signal transduction histidine kinase
MFESASAGLAILRGRDLIVEAVNNAFEALAPGAPVVGQPAAVACPELSQRLSPMGLRVLDTGHSLVIPDLRLRLTGAAHEASRPRYFTFCLRRLATRDGEPRLWVAFIETTARARARRRAELLSSYSTGLNSHPELAVVVRRTLRRAVALLGGRNGALWMLDADGWTLRAEYGRPIPELRLETFDLRTLPTCREALQTGRAIFFTRSELQGAEAELFDRLDVSAGLVAPLVGSARRLGLLTVSFRGVERRLDEEDLAFAAGLAAQSALAIERARALEQAWRAELAVEASRARLRLLGDLGRTLSTALDWESAVHATTWLAVGRLADWAILDLVGDAGRLRRESVRCAPRAPAPPWAPGDGDAGRDAALNEAMRSRLTRSFDLTDGGDAGLFASLHLASLRAAGAGTVILAPLVVRGESLGVLTLARGADVPPYDLDDVSLTQDLATRIALALQDARLLRSAERAMEARGDIIAMAHHELRTPLTALGLEVGHLARATPDDERTAQRVKGIQRATNRLTRAVEQLLDIAHIASGDLGLIHQPIDLVALTRDVVARLSPELERSGCSVQLVAPKEVPAFGDRLRIRGLVHHLLDHAARLGPREPIVVVLARRHGRSTLEVRYRGAPLPPEIRERLAAPLRRHTGRRLSLADAELGLWIARWIVEAHGGRLLVHPAQDGAAFLAELPGDAPARGSAA